MLNGGHLPALGASRVDGGGIGASIREQRRPMWTQHEKTVLRLLMREYAGVTEFDPPDIHKHPIKNEMWRLLTARYNDHPNVRNRDTKQLRKAWENLKYRARKLGTADTKRNGSLSTARTPPTNGNLQDVLEAPWPLDGVSFTHGGAMRELHDLDNQDGEEEDSKSVIFEEELKGNAWIDERRKNASKATSEGENGSLTLPQPSDNNHHFKGVHDGIFNFSRFGSLAGGADLSVGGRGAVLNLQPLVNSLVGGALPALLPFLSSPPNTPLPSEVFLNPPFTTNPLLPPSEDCPSDTSVSKDEVGHPRTLSGLLHQRTSPLTWSSDPAAEETTTSPKTLKAEVKEEDFFSDPEEGEGEEFTNHPATPCSDVVDRASSTVSRLLLRKAREQQQHFATIRLLRAQLSHAEAQHRVKMRVLEAQLEYWQTKLKVQQEAAAAGDDMKDGTDSR